MWIQFVILILCLIIVTAKDFYEILGVKRDASEKEIKRQFRQLGKKKQKFFLLLNNENKIILFF